MSPRRAWAIAGFSGSGKSTVAPAVARLAGRVARDLDEAVGHDRVLALLAAGEAPLREAEADALARILEQDGEGVVVALGGGALEGAATRALLKERFRTAWLDVPLARCLERVRAHGQRRPLLEAGDADAFHARRSAGARHADVVVDGDGPPGEVARRVHRALEELA